MTDGDVMLFNQIVSAFLLRFGLPRPCRHQPRLNIGIGIDVSHPHDCGLQTLVLRKSHVLFLGKAVLRYKTHGNRQPSSYLRTNLSLCITCGISLSSHSLANAIK